MKSEMYDKGWVILTGRSIISPHPHRPYTFEEFVDKLASVGDDDEFCIRFFHDMKHKL